MSVAATAASRKTPLDVIMGGQWNFWRKGEFTFFLQRYLQPLYLSRSSPHTQKSLPFPLRLLLSRFYPWVKYEKIEGWKQSFFFCFFSQLKTKRGKFSAINSALFIVHCPQKVVLTGIDWITMNKAGNLSFIIFHGWAEKAAWKLHQFWIDPFAGVNLKVGETGCRSQEMVVSYLWLSFCSEELLKQNWQVCLFVFIFISICTRVAWNVRAS